MIAVALRSGISKFIYYSGGIIDDPDLCNPSYVDHAVVMVGYIEGEDDNNHFILKIAWVSKKNIH